MERSLDLFAGLGYRQDFWPLSGSKAPGELLQAVIAEGCVNCQLALHLVYEHYFHILLPSHLRSLEMWEDDQFSRHLAVGQATEGRVLTHEPWEVGDILFFADPAKILDPMWYHLAVIWEFEEGGHPRLLHAVKFQDEARSAVVSCPLWKFEQRKHRVFIGAKRLTEQAQAQLSLSVVHALAES